MNKDSRRILATPVSQVQGFDFAHQGILGIWDGLPALPSFAPPPDVPPPSPVQSVSASPVQSYRALLDPHPHPIHFPSSSSSTSTTDLRIGMGDRRRGHVPGHRGRSHSPAESTYGEFRDAVLSVLERSGIAADKERTDKVRATAVLSGRVLQRRLCLRLCGWTVGHDELTETIKRYVSSVCYMIAKFDGEWIGGKKKAKSVAQQHGLYSPGITPGQRKCSCEAKVHTIINHFRQR
jgi:WD repeat-containing protein mio